MRKLILFSLCLVLGLALWGCKPADTLTKPTYVGIQLSGSRGFTPINDAESVVLNNLLAFSKWKTSSKNSSETPVFSLIDDEDKTFDFIQIDDAILIRITDQESTIYYTVTLDQTLDELKTATLDRLNLMASKRSLLSALGFRAANLGNDWSGQATDFTLTTSQSEALRASGLLDMANWQDGGQADVDPIPDAILKLNGIDLKLKLEGSLVRIYVYTGSNPADGIPTFTMDGFRFEKVMDYLRSIRETFIIGPSTELMQVVFKKADFNLDGTKTWAIDGWSLNLSADDSSQISSILQMSNWIRLTDPFTFDAPTADIILYINGGGTISFGSFGDYVGHGAIVERPGETTEYYETGLYSDLYRSDLLTLLVTLWNPPFKDVVKTFAYTKIAIAYEDPTDEMGYSTNVYPVNQTQRAMLQAKMDYASWSIEKDTLQFHVGWVAMLSFSDESGENAIMIYDQSDRTVIKIRNIISSADENSAVFYVAPLSVYEDLWAVAKAQFE